MDTIVKVADGACPTSPTDIYTAAVKVSLLAVDISNPTGAPQGVTLQINGAILFSVSMPALGGTSWHGPQCLEIGHKINLVADSAACFYNITGVEIT